MTTQSSRQTVIECGEVRRKSWRKISK